MKASLHLKLEHILQRYQDLGTQLTQSAVLEDRTRYADCTREYHSLQTVAQCYQQYQELTAECSEVQEMLADKEMHLLAEAEIMHLQGQLKTLEQRIKILLLPEDLDKNKNIYLEIRAGTGGDEAALFAGDLFRMYARYAENQLWEFEMISAHEGEYGGYREIVCRIVGNGVYGALKFESGVHRVQRVPATESQGRLHTSACTVAILPEVAATDEITIDRSDLRIDTYRASGAGGQHINKTDSAVRIMHLPSGLVIECQDERSQHKNRARAMALLEARLLDLQRCKQEQERADTRRLLIGSGDRSERIRTYNFPQNRMTDHRINLTLYSLEAIMAGDIAALLKALAAEHRAEQLARIE